jgi:hypothetical protein
MSTDKTTRIVIAHEKARELSQLESLAAVGAFSVWYFGNSFADYTELRKHLPTNWSMPVPGSLLNSAADRLRHCVIDLDAQAWPSGVDRLPWDASLLGERGPLASPLMLNLARLLVFVEAISNPGRHLVIAQDRAHGRLFMDEARRRGLSVGSVDPWMRGLQDRLTVWRDLLLGFLYGARRRASLVRRFLLRKLQLARGRRRHPLPVEAMRQANVLLTVWGRAETFPQQGSLHREFNYGRLPDLLRQAGFRTAYLVHPLTYVASFRKILGNAFGSAEPIAFVEDFIPWWAIVQAGFSGLFFPQQIKTLLVCGIDATPVLRLEAARDRLLANSAEAQLLRFVGPGLARLGIRPSLLLHLHEAQPWEKMLALGVRRHLPSTRVAGVQHTPFAWNYLSLFPSRRSIAEGAIPDLLLASGDGYADWFCGEGFPIDRVRVLGAVRYENWMDGRMPLGKAILCCTGIELDEATELVIKAAAASEGLGAPLIVNFHPVTDQVFRASLQAAVTRAFGCQPSHLVFSAEPMRHLLEQARVVLYTTSAACFDAIQAGRTAIYVARDLVLDYDKLPENIALRCRSVEELRDVLRRSDVETAQTPSALQRWLAPVVDAKTLRAVLSPGTAA